MSNGWTRHQYALVRGALGLYLMIHFAGLLPWGGELFAAGGVLPADASPLFSLFPSVLRVWDDPLAVLGLLAGGTVCGGLLVAGRTDRAAALGAWYVLACLYARNPLIANPSLPYVGWLLLAHALIAPPREIDLARPWRMPDVVHAAGWIALAVGYSYSGLHKLSSPSWLDGSALADVLANPLARGNDLVRLLASAPAGLLRALAWGALALELLFVPLALSRRLRPWLWGAMLTMHASLLAVVDFADLTWGMLLMHAFTFDPGWVRGREEGTDRVFYDGSCGLCQWWVQFLLQEDRRRAALSFAPLGGKSFASELSEAQRRRLPDSVVVLTAQGELLTRSSAVRRMLERLGGVWTPLADVLGAVPRPLLDAAYDAVAAARRVSPLGAPACRVLPGRLRRRFAA